MRCGIILESAWNGSMRSLGMVTVGVNCLLEFAPLLLGVSTVCLSYFYVGLSFSRSRTVYFEPHSPNHLLQQTSSSNVLPLFLTVKLRLVSYSAS